MANSFALSRSHLIYGFCVPLAVLIGYLLAEPSASGTVLMVALVFGVLSIPLLMRWHHLLLICSWNAMVTLYFLPGRPPLWMALSAVSLFFSLLNRSMGQNLGFFSARSVARSLLFLGLVVMATAFVTGGIGFRALGSESFGGKKYAYLFAAIVGYFALAGQRIKPGQAGWYVAVFFLSGLTALLGYLAASSGLDTLIQMFPLDDAIVEMVIGADTLGGGLTRMSCFTYVGMAIYCFMLARHGVRGVLDFTRPWRMLLMALALVACLIGGFRAILVLYILTFVSSFYWEGLFRTRYLAMVVLGGALVGAAFIPFVRRLPLSMQRTMSFLPISVDPLARQSAEASTEWRIEMWKEILPEVPKYLIKGKGYSLNAGELYMSTTAAAFQNPENGEEIAAMSGDYHNGPLSVVLPFGLAGVAAFLWFICASLRLLYGNYRQGDPSLRSINTFLLAYFIARLFFFTFVFGGLNGDLMVFTGLVGLSVSLNGGEPDRRRTERLRPALA